MVWILPSALPIPLLSAALDSIFTRFQPPTISLLSSPLALAVGAGVRSALVVDLGWNETVVTSIYEYREVASKRSVRGGKALVEQTHKLLAARLSEPQSGSDDAQEHVLSFEECSDIATRMVWCRPCQVSPRPAASSDGLETVQEHDEAAGEGSSASPGRTVTIPIRSWRSATSLELPFDALAEPCEDAFFDSQYSPTSFDDHELPLHMLVYRSLLLSPVDVRGLCMSRIIFTGGCSNVLGLRGRIFDEVSHLVRERGWDPVQGKGVAQLQANPKLKRTGSRQGGDGPVEVPSGPGREQDGVWDDGAPSAPEPDPIEEQLNRGNDKRPRVEGEMRAIESLGAWGGASLVTHLKTQAIATIDREIWLLHGAAGAGRPSEVDHKTQRQSLGAGGLIRGSVAGSAAWTLGVWGAN